MPTRQRKNPEEKVKYLVQRRGQGNFVIEIPASWKVTFGYVNPNRSSDGYRSQEGHCLRVYEGEKLRAVYGDVTGFRDLSIPYATEIRKETGSSSWSMDSEGNFESNKKVNVERALIAAPAFDSEDIPL